MEGLSVGAVGYEPRRGMFMSKTFRDGKQKKMFQASK